MKLRVIAVCLLIAALMIPMTAYAGPAAAPASETQTAQPEIPVEPTGYTPVALAIKGGSAAWRQIDRGLAFLHISGATARCSATVVTNQKAAITVSMTLQRLISGKWQNLETWKKSATGTSLSDERGKIIEPGGSYRALIRIRVDSDNLTVYAYPEQQPLLVGDVDHDSRILAKDARLALRISARLYKGDAYAPLCADYNCDGAVRAGDARSILRRSAGLKT